MFTALRIKHFRGFRDLKINGFGRVNLIGGANGVGKTALLEALFLLLGETNLSLVLTASSFRGLHAARGQPDEIAHWIWGPFFYNFETSKPIEIAGKQSRGRDCQLRIQEAAGRSAKVLLNKHGNGTAGDNAEGLASKKLVIAYRMASSKSPRTAELVIDQGAVRIIPPPPPPEATTYFLSSRAGFVTEDDVKLYDQFEVAKKALDILPALQILEPRLTALRTITSVGGTTIFGDIGFRQLIPLGLMGDGINRLTSVLLRIAAAEHGFVLIDEIETGLHYSVMSKVWEAIALAAQQFDVQIFCTTHSFECIFAAHRAFQTNGHYELCFFRLDEYEGKIDAKRLDEEMLEVVGRTDFEIR